MTQHRQDRHFPLGALIGAGSLVAFALCAVCFARMSGIGTTHALEANPLQSRELRFIDRYDGAVVVDDARSDQTVAILMPGTNNFVRGVMRSFARERRRENDGTESPFLLTRWSDGRLTIEDPTTHERIELISFGPTNLASFAQFLNDRSASR
ncbi:MAG TPA: photosynthetic complex assembly protein PuhC [Xanthobacteraceae bacterium]|nr:photosynthetic complex assembly protein PuhC [Xanthobacteraceae bacterium]